MPDLNKTTGAVSWEQVAGLFRLSDGAREIGTRVREAFLRSTLRRSPSRATDWSDSVGPSTMADSMQRSVSTLLFLPRTPT